MDSLPTILIFGDTVEQMLQLNQFGLIACHGPDAEKFLQGQLTCDVTKINPTISSLGCACDQKGRVFATFRLFKANDTYFLSLPKSILSYTLNELKKFAAFSKVQLDDVSGKWQQLGLIASEESFNMTIHAVKQTNDELIICLSEQPIRYLVVKPNLNTMEQENLTAINQWALLNIQQGIAEVEFNTIGQFTPHALNYPQLGGVDFKKGCYRGQEIVARMQYLGKLKQHLYHATASVEIKLEPGNKLYSATNNEVGEIVNVAKNSENQYEMLVSILDAAKESDQVYLERDEKKKLNFKK
jgi:folate-binding protein YgfZ